jgi:hypothetical protein
MAAILKHPRDVRLPPGCGEDLNEVLLFNPYHDAFQKARRLRFCMVCKTQGSMDENCRFTCKKCATEHVSNLTAPRMFNRFNLSAGRGGGKTLIGAHAGREEMQVPNGIGWVLGATHKLLHDSTFPTLVRRIPPHWIKRWDPEHTEITLMNGHLIAFRSLEDPERARGPHGVTWGWFDEAAQCPVRGYDVFEPTLTKASGIVICTSTVMGFDWTYDKIEKHAQRGEPGFYSVSWWTEENPLFKSNPEMMRQIAQKQKTSDPAFFAQEYRAERRNAEGLVYNFQTLEDQYLPDERAVQKYIPEWPNLDPSRQRLIGLDSGADHPFGAVLAIVTPDGVFVVADYLKRMQAISQQLDPICLLFGVRPSDSTVKWSANKNEANLRLEFGMRGVGVIPAENKHEIGIQRVQSWLHSKQLFLCYTARTTFDQMLAYRYAPNLQPDGQKKAKEAVFKFADELPDCLRYLLMAWPQLPAAEQALMTDAQKARWAALDDKARQDVERVRDYNKQMKSDELKPEESGYPLGDFFGGQEPQWFT